MDISHTLLESAVAMRKARFVRNSAAYLQTCMVPARDLFVASTETVASVVVVPLVSRLCADPQKASTLPPAAPQTRVHWLLPPACSPNTRCCFRGAATHSMRTPQPPRPPPNTHTHTHTPRHPPSPRPPPQVVRDMAFGACYFTLDCPSDFVNLQDTLLGFTASVTLMVHHKLSGRTRLLGSVMSEVGRGGA